MVNLAVVYANIQGGMTSKHVEGCMNTGPLVLWLSEQHKKPGCLQELRRQEALVFGIEGENVFVNWLTF